MFGAQVMRGILEEKTSRIVEVIISSVKPFQLMMGKVVGIGLIALTQFVIWLTLTAGITFVTKTLITPNPAKIATEQQAPTNLMSAEQQLATEQIGQNQVDESMVNGLIDGLAKSNIILVVFAFLFYFLGGYLLYGSLFAAIGAAVDSEADTQQFMLPITIPLILALFVMINSFLNPSGQLAVWFSIIPLTSPIVMMARIPFGVPPGQLFLSMALLIATFIFTIWLAAKIYRTGILMYGKKVSYSELWKWIRY
jgi:ABC-2 type transport system permease protein